MAQIVATIGIPHTPAFPAMVERDGPACETAQLYAAVRQELERARADLLVIFDTDHLNTFFLDNLPVFSIGVADTFQGPNDETPALKVRAVKSHRGLSEYLRAACLASGFDVALLQEFSVDHSVMVPLHFLTPAFDVPVIPIFICGHVPPLPAAARCLAFGRAVQAALKDWDEPLRVALIGSGSFSLDVYGTQINPGQSFGVPSPAWAERVGHLIETGDTATLVREATAGQLEQAGNVGGELLNWIAMLGAASGRTPTFFRAQSQFGHGYAVWHLGEA